MFIKKLIWVVTHGIRANNRAIIYMVYYWQAFHLPNTEEFSYSINIREEVLNDSIKFMH